MNRRALIVAYCFPPHAAIGTHRALRLVNHLVEAGWSVDVLTADPRVYLAGTPVDAQLLERVPSGVRVMRTGAFRGLTRLGRAVEPVKTLLRRRSSGGSAPAAAASAGAGPDTSASPGLVRRLKATVEELCAMPDKDAGWIVPAIRRGLTLTGPERPDAIFSSGPPWSTHVVARALASRLGSRWVADFRDPWVRSPWTRYTSGPAVSIAARLERGVVTHADAVLFTTQSARDEFVSFYGEAYAHRFHAVMNGCDPGEFDAPGATPSAPERFVLLHAGTLYGGRSPLPMLEAVAALVKEDPQIAGRLRVRFLGSTSFPGLDLPRVCATLGLSAIVEFAARVERTESLREMQRASALLILQGGTSMAIPGKFYEYCAAGRPLLALCEESEMTALIRARELGMVVAPGDRQAIEQAIRALLGATPGTWNRAPQDVFDGRLRAAEMASVLEGTLHRGRVAMFSGETASSRTTVMPGKPAGADAPHAARSSDRPIRVMHLLFSLRTGGTEMGVVKLVNALDRARATSTICSCKPAGDLKLKLAGDVPLFEFNRRDGNDPQFVLELTRLLKRERPDVLHTHSWGTLFEGLVAARLAGVAHVVHGEHGTLDTRRLNVVAQRWGWRRADCLLSVSSRLADRMAAQIGVARESVHVIRNGIDTGRFRPGRREEARRALDLSATDVVIGTAGRLVPVKDHSSLLQAMALLAGRNVRCRLVLAGDGPLRDALHAQAAALGLTANVTFLGARSDVDLVLSACDVFVLSSLSEGLSNTILEAMATGLPVVATHVGGADELVEDGRTGLLVPSAQPPALASALATLVESVDLRLSMGTLGREKAQREFSIARMASDYERLYDTVARGVTPMTRADAEAPVCVA
jgi:sugar transferase (PEP-CTERM/EpsH1 system associated)